MKLYVIATLTILLSACGSSTTKTDGSTDPQVTKGTVTKAEGNKDAAPAKKEAKVAAAGEATVCSYGEVKREIKIVQGSSGCTVEYTKDGSTQEIASGAANSPFCGEIADRVKNNLTTAGYNCK